jgi:hypothetical protein
LPAVQVLDNSLVVILVCNNSREEKTGEAPASLAQSWRANPYFDPDVTVLGRSRASPSGRPRCPPKTPPADATALRHMLALWWGRKPVIRPISSSRGSSWLRNCGRPTPRSNGQDAFAVAIAMARSDPYGEAHITHYIIPSSLSASSELETPPPPPGTGFTTGWRTKGPQVLAALCGEPLPAVINHPGSSSLLAILPR